MIGRIAGAEDGGGEAGELGEAFAQAGTPQDVTIFVPPAVFEKEQTVFDVPVLPDRGEQLVGADRVGVAAIGEIARVVRDDCAVGRNQIAINAQPDLIVGKAERLADVVRVVQVEPQPAAFLQGPFFSTVSAAGGFSCAIPKHCVNASSKSG